MQQDLTRRRFLQTSGLALTGAWAMQNFPLSGFLPPVTHLGVQLWSIREDMKRDPAGAVKALSQMGYVEVEGFGYSDGKMFGMPLRDFLKLLKDNGITMPSTHLSMDLKDYDGATKTLGDKVKRAVDDLASVGLRYIICPWLPEPDRTQIAPIVGLCQAVAKHVQSAGARFAYHNHDFEFTTHGQDGRLLYEWLLHEVDPKLMAMEMDIYWVAYAGYNPLDWFRLYPGRFELCHAKDLARTAKRETVELGDGSIDFTAIFKQSPQAGFQYYMIELEHYVTTPLQGVQRARENFLKLKF